MIYSIQNSNKTFNVAMIMPIESSKNSSGQIHQNQHPTFKRRYDIMPFTTFTEYIYRVRYYDKQTKNKERLRSENIQFKENLVNARLIVGD